MKAKLEGWTIVVIGQWNPRNFIPEFLGQRVFDSKEVMIEIDIPAPRYLVRLSSPDVLIIPSDERVVLAARQATDGGVSALENATVRLLGALPHTPVSALGVNFAFVGEASDAIHRLLELDDTSRLSDNGLDIHRSEVRRWMQAEEKIIHIQVGYDYKQATADLLFNFNVAGETPEVLISKLRDQSLSFKKLAYELASKLYDVTVTEGG